VDEARAAGLWGLVATLAAQLAELPPENVVPLDAARRRRDGEGGMR
jgi:hypothetical protein